MNQKLKLSISEIDLLIQQLSSCWSAPAGAVIKKGMVVKISAKISQIERYFTKVFVLLTQIYHKVILFMGLLQKVLCELY